MLIYLIGSLKNPEIPTIGNYFRELGFEVFDDWHAPGPDADDYWRDYERARGHNLKQALQGWAGKHIFEFDKYHLDRADMGVMIMPAGKSGHLELGYLIGKGKPGYIVFDKEPERFDVMLQFANGVFYNVAEAGEVLKHEYL